MLGVTLISLSHGEIWGENSKADMQRDFFNSYLSGHGMVDVEPLKLVPTWHNQRTGKNEVAKRLDIFLLSKALLEKGFLIHSLVSERGFSDH
jgi:hypothetical protein